MLNPNFEYQNPKQIRITKIQMAKTMTVSSTAKYKFWTFENLNFEFVSNFVLRG